MSNDQTLLFAVDPGTHSATITDLLPLGDGASVVTVAMDKRIRWWNADDDKPVTILGRIGPGTDGAIDAAAVHTADGIVCVAAHDGATGRSTLRFRVPWLDRWQRTFRWDGRIADLAMSPDDRFLVVATAGSDRTGSDGGTDARLAVFRFDDLVPYDESTDSGVADYGTPADDAAREYAVEDDAAPEYPADHAAEAEFQLDRATDILAPPPPLFEIPLVIGPANVAVGPMVDGGARIVVTPTFIGVPQLFALTDDGLTELPVGGSATLDGRSDDGPERDRTDRDPTGGAANGSAPSVGLRASVAVSSHFVAIAGENSGLTILDHDGRVVAEAVSGAGGGSPVGVAFSPDGERLIVGSRAAGRSEVTVHDVAVDFPIVGRRRYDDNAIAVAFAGEDEVVTAGGSRFSVHRWDPTTSEPSAADRFIDGAGQVIDAVGLSGREVGFGNPDPVRPDEPRGEVPTLARRFNLDLLTLVPGAEEPEQEVPLEEFRRARHRTSGGGELELARGQVFVEPAGIELADGVGFSSDQASGYSVIPGDRVVVGRRSGAVGLFPSVEDVDGSDVPRFRPIARLVGHVSAVLDVVADERWLVTGGRDQVIRLWPADPAGTAAAGDDQIATVEPTLSLFITATNEWVIWTRSGYYASSPNGDRYISYHHNRGENQPARAYSGDQFVKNLYRPDIIRHVLEHQSEAAALDALGVAPIDIEDSLPPHVRILNWDTSTDDPSIADLAFEVVDAARPTTTIVILQNGIPAVEIDARDQPGRAVDAAGRVRRYSEVIFLEPGRNE
ncbi:MAG: WD40 repeat domain-containing protein, partial [Actinomycetota bacterium]